jgi:hypothetical protein
MRAHTLRSAASAPRQYVCAAWLAGDTFLRERANCVKERVSSGPPCPLHAVLAAASCACMCVTSAANGASARGPLGYPAPSINPVGAVLPRGSAGPRVATRSSTRGCHAHVSSAIICLSHISCIRTPL